MGAPVWRGAVAQRAVYAHALAAGQAVTEFEPTGPAADEMRLLWRDVSEAARAMAQYQRARLSDQLDFGSCTDLRGAPRQFKTSCRVKQTSRGTAFAKSA